jgi:hypothetical protein
MMTQVAGFTYYSSTFDVIAWPREEESAWYVAASFATYADACAYTKANAHAFIRPPSNALAHALAWIAYVGGLQQGGEYATDIDTLRSQQY